MTTITTIHFYRNNTDRSLMVTEKELVKNPFSFQIEYVGRMNTVLSVGQVRSLLKQGMTHIQIYEKYRYRDMVKIFIYTSCDAIGGKKATIEERLNQPVLLAVDVERKHLQESLGKLREGIRRGLSVDELSGICTD